MYTYSIINIFFAITVKSINDEPFEEPEKEIAIEYNGYKEK